MILILFIFKRLETNISTSIVEHFLNVYSILLTRSFLFLLYTFSSNNGLYKYNKSSINDLVDKTSPEHRREHLESRDRQD